MNEYEYATTVPPGAQPRSPVSSAMRTILRGIRDREVTCLHCGEPAVLLRHRMGKPLPLCFRHSRSESLDHEIANQRAIAQSMRSNNKGR